MNRARQSKRNLMEKTLKLRVKLELKESFLIFNFKSAK